LQGFASCWIAQCALSKEGRASCEGTWPLVLGSRNRMRGSVIAQLEAARRHSLSSVGSSRVTQRGRAVRAQGDGRAWAPDRHPGLDPAAPRSHIQQMQRWLALAGEVDFPGSTGRAPAQRRTRPCRRVGPDNGWLANAVDRHGHPEAPKQVTIRFFRVGHGERDFRRGGRRMPDDRAGARGLGNGRGGRVARWGEFEQFLKS
jgi:hypothetical protein